MKKKLFIALFLATLLSMGAGFYITYSIDQVALKLNNIVKVHKVQILQEKLVFHLREVQAHLVSKDTRFASDVGIMTRELAEMDRTMHSCFDCHHSKAVTFQLTLIKKDMEEFILAMEIVFNLKENSMLYQSSLESAFTQGQKLAQHLYELVASANKTLGERAEVSMRESLSTQKNLRALVLFIPIFVLIIGLYLLRSFTNPLSSLLEATRRLTGGDLEYRIKGLHHEFGELADSFNSMAQSIMQQMKDMQRAEQMAALGQLAAGLAHEIKNPLAGIKVSMEVLANELEIDEEDKRILRLVILEINHINTLINELLNYARPSKPNFDTISITKILDKTIEAASYSAQKPDPEENQSNSKGKILFTKNFTPGNFQVKADPAQLHQIFLNIILNSIDSMPKAGEIKVRTFLEEGTNFIGVEISDTGPGLDDEARDKIFEPFFTTKKKGTGLGLAICKRLIEQHDGKIVANKNVDGGGASFSVYLPLDSSAEGPF